MCTHFTVQNHAFKQAGTQPDFSIQCGNTDFLREKNHCSESDKLFQMHKAVQKHRGVAEGPGESDEQGMVKKSWQRHGQETSPRDGRTSGCVANRQQALVQKKLTGTGVGFHFPIHSPCRAPSE